MLPRDDRYGFAKGLLQTGYLTTFHELFKIVPKSIVAADLGMNNVRFTKLINHIDEFTLKQINMLAKLFYFEEDFMLDFMIKQHKENLYQRRKKWENMNAG